MPDNNGPDAPQQGDIVASASDFAFVATDLDGRITAWSPGAELTLGWTADEILGAHIAHVFTPEDRIAGRAGAEMEEAAGTGRASDERWHSKKDGSRFWASGAMQPLYAEEGKHIGYVKVLRDRTDRHLAGEALRNSEATLQAVLDALPVGIFIADASGRVIRDNAAHRELWGKPIEASSTDDYREYIGWRPDGGERIQPQEWALSRALLLGEVTRGDLVECQPLDGGPRRLFLNNAAPISDKAGKVIGAVATEQNVSELRASVQRDALLAAIVASSSDAMVSFDDREGRITTWNAAAERLFGYTEAEAIGGPVGLLVPPELAFHEPKGVYARALRGEPVVEHETVRVTKTGKRIQVSVTATRMVSKDGQLLGVSGIFRDITERKRAEDELRVSEARLKRLLDTLDLATVFVRDLDGTIRFWSGGCERMFGWTSEEAVGQLAHDLLGTRFPLPQTEIQAVLLREEQWEGYLTSRRRDGTEIVTGVRKVLRREGGAIIVMETLSDVTAQRRAEAALGESEARFRTMTEAMPQMIWSALPDGSHDYFNERWYEFTGAAVGARDGQAWAELVHPEDRERLERRWRHSLDTGEPYEFEFRLRRADGSYRRLLARAVAMRDDSGAIVRWLGSSTDIEEIAQAREVVARDRAELEELVQARTHDLEETQARLARAQRMEALGQLAGGIAHDFNNVLQAVQGGAALIERRADDQQAVQRVAHMVVEAAERGAGITRRLLSFARRGDLRAEPIEIAVLLESLREILVHTLGTAIRVLVTAQPGIAPVFADRGQLETVLVNLATNARDAMPDGGTLTLSADFGLGHPKPDQLGLEPSIRIAVTDTGTGMTSGVLARASEPFFTTKAQGKGTGLGLAMAKGFAEQSGGALQIESEPGRGTAVALWLPPADQGTRANTGLSVRPHQVLAPAGQRQILLVDDHDILRELLAEQLQEFGYEVTRAASGEQAIALLEKGLPIDLLVTDLSMPGMDGVALIRALQHKRRHLPAVLLTGYAGDAAALAIGREVTGPFILVRKPVKARYLAERMAVLLEAKRE